MNGEEQAYEQPNTISASSSSNINSIENQQNNKIMILLMGIYKERIDFLKCIIMCTFSFLLSDFTARL